MVALDRRDGRYGRLLSYDRDQQLKHDDEGHERSPPVGDNDVQSEIITDRQLHLTSTAVYADIARKRVRLVLRPRQQQHPHQQPQQQRKHYYGVGRFNMATSPPYRSEFRLGVIFEGVSCCQIFNNLNNGFITKLYQNVIWTSTICSLATSGQHPFIRYINVHVRYYCRGRM